MVPAATPIAIATKKVLTKRPTKGGKRKCSKRIFINDDSEESEDDLEFLEAAAIAKQQNSKNQKRYRRGSSGRNRKSWEVNEFAERYGLGRYELILTLTLQLICSATGLICYRREFGSSAKLLEIP